MRRQPSIERIAALLTRPVKEEERESMLSLRAITEAALSEVRDVRRRFGRMEALMYIQFFVNRENDDEARDFVEEVVEAPSAVAAQWRIFDTVVVPAVNFLTATIESYVQNIDNLDGERWYSLFSEPLQLVMPRGGAPGVLFRNHVKGSPIPMLKPTTSATEFRSTQHISKTVHRMERIAHPNLPVAIRRWMGRELAAYIVRNELLNCHKFTSTAIREAIRSYAWPQTNDGGVTYTDITDIEPSADALIAIDALVKESQMNDANFPNNAGFLGPDEWYQ
jgi:hypothetical protein